MWFYYSFLNCLEFIFCRSFPSLVVSCLEKFLESPILIGLKAGLVLLNSLNLCLESFLFLYQIWKRVLLGGVLLAVGSSLPSLEPYHATPFWLVEFLLRNQLIVWMRVSLLFVIFLLLLLIFYLCLYFLSVVLLCVSVCSSLGLSCLGLCASWTWLTISFPMLGKFSAISSSKFSLCLLLLGCL